MTEEILGAANVLRDHERSGRECRSPCRVQGRCAFSPQSSLLSHDDAFERLLSLIPAKFYVPVDEEHMDTKYQKNKHTKSQKQQEAEERKNKLQAAKRAKVRLSPLTQLDPDNVKSVKEIQQDRRRRLEDGIELEFDAEDDDENTDDAEDDGLDDYEDDDDDAESTGNGAAGPRRDEDDEEEEDDDDNKPTEAQLNGQTTAAGVANRRATVAELRERLHNKIEMLHRKRNPSDTPTDDTVPSTKQELMEERRRQRGEMRDRRRRERKEARRQAKDQSASKDGGRAKADVSGSSRQAGLLVNDATNPERVAPKKPEVESRMSFSHVNFGLDTPRKNKYALPNDPKAALAMLEARKRKEENRVQKQVERGQDEDQVREAAEEAERWNKAIAAAEGVRIRDNEHLLKQTLKRREKSKAKSSKAWCVRLTHIAGTTGAAPSRKHRPRSKRSVWRTLLRDGRTSVRPVSLRPSLPNRPKPDLALKATAAPLAARRAAKAARARRNGSSAEIDAHTLTPTALLMSATAGDGAPGADFVNPYEGNRNLSPNEQALLGEYARLAQTLRRVRTTSTNAGRRTEHTVEREHDACQCAERFAHC